MNIRVFDLERIQSLYENTVPYNLTESGFHPFTLAKLLSETQLQQLNSLVLGYGQTNGDPALRHSISDLYVNSGPENVIVTNGSSEANFVACHTLLEKGDELVDPASALLLTLPDRPTGAAQVCPWPKPAMSVVLRA